jgi:hypothetical protein
MGHRVCVDDLVRRTRRGRSGAAVGGAAVVGAGTGTGAAVVGCATGGDPADPDAVGVGLG